MVVGCNVENASYGLTVCAERTAVFAAVAKGALLVARAAARDSAALTHRLPPLPCGGDCNEQRLGELRCVSSGSSAGARQCARGRGLRSRARPRVRCQVLNEFTTAAGMAVLLCDGEGKVGVLPLSCTVKCVA